MESKVIVVPIVLAVISVLFALSLKIFFALPSLSASEDLLRSAHILRIPGAVGPESLVFDANGEGPYTGVADGRILKWQGQDRGWTDFAFTSSNRTECVRPFAPELEHVCGRPLGIKFGKKSGDLYIADAYLGLLVVGPSGGLATPLVTHVEGQPLRFANDIDISEDEDIIYFTDSSTVFQRRQFASVLLHGDKTGRLMKYDKSTKEVTVLIRNLAFANGVALSKDGSFVLVDEANACRILRLWLRGPNAGQVDIFAELPGFPDNVRRNSKGEFWVALHCKASPFAQLVYSSSWVRKVLLNRPFIFKPALIGWKPHATAIKLSEKGEILQVLEDCDGKALKFISEVEERDGKLWIDMKSKLTVIPTLLAAFSIIFASNLKNFFAPPSLPPSNHLLHTAHILHIPGAVGPESLVFDHKGDGPYTGVADGRILKWQGSGWTDFAFTSSNRTQCVRPFAPELEHICGRPLGIKFGKKSGDLYIADAYLGLLVVGPGGGLATPLVTHFEGHPLRFTNDIDISEDEDAIYFTDSTTLFHRREFMYAVLSLDKSGRLMKYDKSSKEVTVLIGNLAFANGVALSRDGSFLVVAESNALRILRLWLRGPNAGQVDTFAELPGFPDNVRRNSKGEFWVALHSKASPFAKWASSSPWAGKVLLKLPLSFKQLHAAFTGWKPHATAMKLSESGEILQVLEDCDGKALKFISEVEERDGKLWIVALARWTIHVGKWRLKMRVSLYVVMGAWFAYINGVGPSCHDHHIHTTDKGVMKLVDWEFQEKVSLVMEEDSYGGGVGPESFAFDPHGHGPYTALSDGRIIKWDHRHNRWLHFALASPHRDACGGASYEEHRKSEHICGRPLGLGFSPNGDLYIADAYLGLLVVGPNGGVATTIANHVEGSRLAFTNSLDIDHTTGVVYFTCSSSTFQRRNYMSLILSGDKTGMLMKYEPETKQVSVILRNLSFANGVALSQNNEYILVVETGKRRVLRYWLATPKAGTLEVLIELPGFPDNIKRSPRGGFWVGIYSRQDKLSKWVLSYPWIAKSLLKLPLDITQAYSCLAKIKGSSGLGIRVSEEGGVMEIIEHKSGMRERERSSWSVSEVEERDGTLWVGSVDAPFARKYKILVA
ncbi:protein STRICTOSIDINE SYNTHASE-LIKE 10 [Senna tora]|uniref:Protein STRICTOSIDINE SYNTHASE-LIKE 10 n=1 Tax=Senna tora TaxID=362788 RepID=A0A834TBG8_9FABA|nr:protein STRICTOSIDINE SYNTHASE-LIKE 10 [Senna tora]